MFDQEMISNIDYRIGIARDYAPKDPFTSIALLLVKATTSAQMILLPIQLITTAIGGCLIALTFGLLALILSFIWAPFLGLLLGTSWLWLKAPYLRPILLLPGVLIANIANLFIMLAPEPEKEAKYTKLSIAEEWPLSWYLMSPLTRDGG